MRWGQPQRGMGTPGLIMTDAVSLFIKCTFATSGIFPVIYGVQRKTPAMEF